MNLHNAEFIRSVTAVADCPKDGLPQIAFAGKSNVGKSSVINKLLLRKNFARVGEAPGKTTHISISSRSFSFSAGMITVLTPWRRAAMVFSFSPPMGSTLPRRVISPVIATSRRTGIPESAETIAVQRVTPAEGPSFGTAPSGTWI